jgi:hypothetical protein
MCLGAQALEWLLPGDPPGKPISPRTIDRVRRQVRQRCGIGKPVTPQEDQRLYRPVECLLTSTGRLSLNGEDLPGVVVP